MPGSDIIREAINASWTIETVGADNTENNSNHFKGVARVTTVPQKIWVSEDDPSVPVGVIS